MHLKSCQKFVSVDTRGVHVSSYMNRQRAELRTCSSNNSSRVPLRVLSNNVLHRSNTPSVWLKSPRGSALQLLPLPPGCENDVHTFYHSDEVDSPLDVWTVIRPGLVREKIAIFTSEDEDRALPTNSRGAKAKGSWEEKVSAKRRRRSGSTCRPVPCPPDPPQIEDGAVTEVEQEEEPKISVVEMVALLEQRATEEQIDCIPALALRRSSTTITLSRAPPPEVREEEPECVKVSDMVARLESECLRSRSQGDVSRSNSLRRTVGRVLLASAEQSAVPSQLPPSLPETPARSDHTPPLDLATKSCPQAQSDEAEPVPGLLFLSPITEPDTALRPLVASEPHPTAASPSADSAVCEGGVSSSDFLLMRQRVQRLLEPEPLLSLLPHHLLVSIFRLLDTRSLAALKCSCRYFNFLIQNYGIRPADALWVSHPRYRDDPCKQCKKRYFRGDVSLCRWHHKAFCQPLPHGPGFWMCCHGNHRDTPGCNVGLHDNRWVPAFHSINSPVCGRSQDGD